MTDPQKEKITRFLSDQLMSDSVRQVLLDSFLRRSRKDDTLYLAASRIAIDLLDDAWRDLNNYKHDTRDTQADSALNVGL